MARAGMVIAGLALLAHACEFGNAGADVAGSWVLSSARTLDGALASAEVEDIDLVHRGGTWTGKAACTTYSADVVIEGQGVSVHDVRRADTQCDPPLASVDDVYLTALSEVEHLVVEDDRLILWGENVQLIFTRHEMTGTTTDVVVPLGATMATHTRLEHDLVQLRVRFD